MKVKEKQQILSQNKTNSEIEGEREEGIDILQLNKGIATEQLLERQLSQAWVFYFSSSRLWLIESVELPLGFE